MIYPYDRKAAVDYARRWALSRNPRWYNFDALGGDCTNFVSQCLYAGHSVMNYTPTFGWHYRSLQDRAPAWSGVDPFARFLLREDGPGPFAREAELQALEPGDVIQLCGEDGCYHSLIVSQLLFPSPAGILVCAHTRDSLDRPLATYDYWECHAYHIEGVRLW